jgi:uncharacterized membrane protein
VNVKVGLPMKTIIWGELINKHVLNVKAEGITKKLITELRRAKMNKYLGVALIFYHIILSSHELYTVETLFDRLDNLYFMLVVIVIYLIFILVTLNKEDKE